MLTIAPARKGSTLRDSSRGQAIRHARTCHDHLGGTLGGGLTDAMQHHRHIQPADNSYQLTPSGRDRLEGLGLDVAALRARRRAFARPCLDWTEQRPHLAGALGAAIAQRLLDLRWLCRVPGTRALHITDAGHHGLRDELGLKLTPSA